MNNIIRHTLYDTIVDSIEVLLRDIDPLNDYLEDVAIEAFRADMEHILTDAIRHSRIERLRCLLQPTLYET